MLTSPYEWNIHECGEKTRRKNIKTFLKLEFYNVMVLDIYTCTYSDDLQRYHGLPSEH